MEAIILVLALCCSWVHAFAPTFRAALCCFELSAASYRHCPIRIATTREQGKNGALVSGVKDMISLPSTVECLELSCIQHAPGPDVHSLRKILTQNAWDYVVVTSPEAANVLIPNWDVVRGAPIPVAAVGGATKEMLERSGIQVAFFPSKATAATLAKELVPTSKSNGTTVLYPTSARAKDTLQNDLKARGFCVTRLNTYDTVTAVWSKKQRESSRTVDIACFASPSAVSGWLQNTENNNNVVAACIGETSAEYCRDHGWDPDRIFYPEKPGLPGWLKTIRDSVEYVMTTSYPSSKTETTST
eukprot:Nitzschia sp. Nitz4//scaffold48_size128905//81693//82598//NITZ4_003607-RA/size128905-processed-gene-0.251-mRNA-1//-1//CDS//3329553003//3066//frame0